MQWHDHSRQIQKGSHALFPPSQPAWLNDQTVEDVLERACRASATAIGTIVHDVACNCIRYNIKFTKNEAKKLLLLYLLSSKEKIRREAFDIEFLATNFVNYVTDCIGYVMDPEVELFYSEYNFGTADAIMFDRNKKILRISDLKTGTTPAQFRQLEVYAAHFFLEYGDELGVKVGDCKIELRIYQAGEIVEEYPTAEIILPIMDSIRWHTRVMQSSEEG